ncbi:MAG: DUF4410 domain-containing protein [Chthoniobacterales bacterium]|nr:DUF4410 domain-containing protein [Chthoniobacterales bacterium]
MPGCASVSIKSICFGDGTPQKLPDRIYVEKFKAPSLYFHVNRKGKDLKDLIEQEQLHLAQDLIVRLNKHIAPTFLLPPGATPPQGNYWLVRGSFEAVNEGSRLLRAGLGFGFGKTKMETTAQLLDLSKTYPEPLLTITTTGGSGMAPGAAAAFAPIAPLTLPTTLLNVGGSAGGALGTGISVDRRRTAREIVATISEYSVQHGLIEKSRGLHPKRLGEIPPLFY